MEENTIIQDQTPQSENVEMPDAEVESVATENEESECVVAASSESENVEENYAGGKKKTTIIVLIIAAFLVVVAGIVTAVLLLSSGNDKETEIVEKAAVLMFVSDSVEETHIGDLYYMGENGEKVLIAKDIYKGEYMLMPKTQRVYYTKDNTLYMCEPGEEKEKLADNSSIYGMFFSEDEKTMLFSSYDNESGEGKLYIKTIGSEKEKIGSLMQESDELGYMLSSDGSKVYYCDEDNNFRVWDKETDTEEKISANVYYFDANDDAYSYYIYNEDDSETHMYVNLAGATETKRLSETSQGCTFIQQGKAIIYERDGDYNESEEKWVSDIYIYYDGGEEIRIATDVYQYVVSEDGTKLYYIDTDAKLYKQELPVINDKTLKKPEKIANQVEKAQKETIGNNAEEVTLSPNSRNVAYLDDDNNMYMSVNGKEMAKVGTDVKNMFIGDNRFVFLSNDGNLYVNNNYNKSRNIKKNNDLVAESVVTVSVSKYAQNVIFHTERDSLVLFKNGKDTKELMSDVKEYDAIECENVLIYEKVLSMKDVAGKYYIESEECLLEIDEDGGFRYYLIGEPNYGNVEISSTIDKYKVSIQFTYLSKKTYYTFYKDANGNKYIKNNDDDEYHFTELSEDDFDKKVEAQKKKEEERIAEEKRLEEIENKRKEQEEQGKYYYRNGYYVSNTDTLYASPNYSSATSIKYTSSNTKSVYGYSVSKDGESLWLKVYIYPEGSNRSMYLWVPAK